MKIHITATQLELTPAIKDYINRKIGKLSKFIKRFEKEEEAQVFFEIARTTHHHKSGEIFYAEVNVEIKGDSIRITSTREDIRAAVDEIKDGLKREFKQYKEKNVKERRKKRGFFKRFKRGI